MKAAKAERYCRQCGERNSVGNRVSARGGLCRRCVELISRWNREKWRALQPRKAAERLDFQGVNPYC